jgi:ubiquitin C-terminal hydrolase
VATAPPVLVVQLNRFVQRGGGKTVKTQAYVGFPMELDMNPYCLPEDAVECYDDDAVSTRIYDLTAVVVHQGEMGGGHYIAYARRAGRWYGMSDAHVWSTSVTEVQQAQAYLLFYEAKTDARLGE